ncbi:MAG TPA: Tex family protein [Methanotrichaceae archaeon]|nr:Tex family protein [Methanotrichaceae archaeon]
MNESIIARIASELALKERQVWAVSELLDQGATIPFMARYRKEATSSLDEVAIAEIRDRLVQLKRLEERRDFIISSLTKRDLLTPDLKGRLQAAETLATLEDIYLPYRPKRRTRATVARERGLEPLARIIFAQGDTDPEERAATFVDPQKGVPSAKDAVAGARDIIAEWISEDVEARSEMRQLFEAEGALKSRAVAGKEAEATKEAAKYRDYMDWSEPLSQAPSHRILAMLRGAKEGILSLHISPPEEKALAVLDDLFVSGSGPSSKAVKLSASDSYRRLLVPSMETEILGAAKARADEKAIAVFADNLRQLLLEAPLGQKNVLAVDPGFRTGCKMVVLDNLGRLVHSDVIYPHEPQKKVLEAEESVLDICERFGVEVIAVGNGTAGRETETFLRKLLFPREIPVVAVNEAGASVYSTSQAARDEFPDQDATVRGAVSIGRRLMDPLAELVKIDPQAIGIGQYQHDVDQSSLRQKLDDVVMSCVGMVGVDVNTASRELLTYVAGLGPKLAEAIVKYRNEHGLFKSRKELLKVPRLGPRAFEQAAGFLRIREGNNPLDASAVHPESYKIVERMAEDLGVSVRELMKNESLLKRIDLERYATDKVGMPTLIDILEELTRPGRDPRREFEAFSFGDVEKIEDLKAGMKLPGIVTNVTAFGAFVDIGVHQDGLVHISQLSDRFVRNPSDVVRARQKVTVTVMDVDLERKRISLSMKWS